MARLNQGISNAANGLTTLSTVTKSAGGGLLSMGKGALRAAGRGAGNFVSNVGGGALGMMGLGRFGSRGGGASGGGGRGGGGGMAGMALMMGGGLAVEGVAGAFGGQDTEAGRNISTVGGSVMSMASMGAMVGGPWGAAAGAAAGLALGLIEAKKASEAAAQADREKAAAAAMTTSGKALDRFIQSGKPSDDAAFVRSFRESSAVESAAGSGIKRKEAGFFGRLIGSEGETTADAGKRRAETQKEGAQQAEKYLSAQMMSTGQTFEELKNSTDPTTFNEMTRNIAEADASFAAFQVGLDKQVADLKTEGKYAEAARVQADGNTRMEAMSLSIAKRETAEGAAAAAAKKAAAASASMAAAVTKVAVTFKESFDVMSQALNRSGFEIDNILSGMDQAVTGKASLGGEGRKLTANILSNPEAYSEKERGQALRQGASVLGSSSTMAVKMAEFGPKTRNMALATAANTQASMPAGKEANVAIGNDVKSILTQQIEDTFGKNSPMAETAIKNMEDKIDKAVKESGGETLDVSALVEDAIGPLMTVSEQAAKVIQQANQTVADNLMALGKVAVEIANLEQKRLSRTSALIGMQAQSGLQEQETLGIKVSPAEKMKARQAESASRLGLAPGSNVDSTAISARRIQLQQQQSLLQQDIGRKESRAGTGPGGPETELLKLKTRLAQVNNELQTTEDELEKLPQTLEQGIGDLMSEIQARVSQLDAQKEARAGFAEKLVTSTPQELADMNQTYGLLNKLMNGQTETIMQSRDAQMAYIGALQQGRTAQEAAAAAQSAYADRNKKAIEMLKELSAIEGIDTTEMDLARADLMQNMAVSTGQQNNPFIQKAIEALRTTPEQRAAKDPVLLALKAQAAALRQEQVNAVNQANQVDREKQRDLLNEVANPLIKRMEDVGNLVAAALNNFARATGRPVAAASGGMIYASAGRLINFQPKGTDTVPAMLTPGEYVINREETAKNLPLLEQINSGNYKAGGGSVAGSSTLGKVAQDSKQRSQDRFDGKFYNKLDNVHKETTTTVSNTKNNKIIHEKLDTLINSVKQGNRVGLANSALMLKEMERNNAFPLMNQNNRNKLGLAGTSAMEEIMPLLSGGGMVYASKGQFIPKGTDTVPAMLTGGEFVVNSKATSKNRGALESMNRGGVVYAQEGMYVPPPPVIPYDYGYVPSIEPLTSEEVKAYTEAEKSRKIADALEKQAKERARIAAKAAAAQDERNSRGMGKPVPSQLDPEASIHTDGPWGRGVVPPASNPTFEERKTNRENKRKEDVQAKVDTYNAERADEIAVALENKAKERARIAANAAAAQDERNSRGMGRSVPPEIGGYYGDAPTPLTSQERKDLTDEDKKNKRDKKTTPRSQKESIEGAKRERELQNDRIKEQNKKNVENKRTTYTDSQAALRARLMDPLERRKYYQEQQQRTVNPQRYSGGGVVEYLAAGGAPGAGAATTPPPKRKFVPSDAPPTTSNDTLLLRMLRPGQQAAEQENLNSVMDRWPLVNRKYNNLPVNQLGQSDRHVNPSGFIKGILDNKYLNVTANNQQEAIMAAVQTFPHLKNQGYSVIHSSHLYNNIKSMGLLGGPASPRLKLEEAFMQEMQSFGSAFGPTAFSSLKEFDDATPNKEKMNLIKEWMEDNAPNASHLRLNAADFDLDKHKYTKSALISPVGLARKRHLKQIAANISLTSLKDSQVPQIESHYRMATEENQIGLQRKIMTPGEWTPTTRVGLVNMIGPPKLSELKKMGLQQMIDDYIDFATDWQSRGGKNHAGGWSKGGPVYASAGQLINFQPKGTDTVPAMLTAGEYVINREETQKNLPLLRQINSGNYQRGGDVRVNGPGKATVDRGSQNIVVNINMDPSKMSNNPNTGGVSNTDAIAGFTSKFDSFIQALNQLNLPTEFRHDHNIKITFNGSEFLGELARENGPVANMVIRMVSQEIDKVKTNLRRNTEGAL